MTDVEVLDDTFTYGGWALAIVAICVWFWFARRAFPSFETFVSGFDDELHFGDSPEQRVQTVRSHRVRQLAVVLTAVAAVSLMIGLAIPG